MLPTPSFGMEDYKALAGCIENMDSLESMDGNSNSKQQQQQSQYYMSSDKVEAASRAAAAVLAGGDKDTATTTKSREFQRQHTEVHSNLSPSNSTEQSTSASGAGGAHQQQQQQQAMEQQAEQLIESTTTAVRSGGILDRNGSNESVVVSSPSVSREDMERDCGEDGENASGSLSHSNSPASFLLDVSALCSIFFCEHML